MASLEIGPWRVGWGRGGLCVRLSVSGESHPLPRQGPPIPHWSFSGQAHMRTESGLTLPCWVRVFLSQLSRFPCASFSPCCGTSSISFLPLFPYYGPQSGLSPCKLTPHLPPLLSAQCSDLGPAPLGGRFMTGRTEMSPGRRSFPDVLRPPGGAEIDAPGLCLCVCVCVCVSPWNLALHTGPPPQSPLFIVSPSLRWCFCPGFLLKEEPTDGCGCVRLRFQPCL